MSNKAPQAKVKDVSRRSTGVGVEVVPIEGVELLLALLMLYGGDPYDSFDLGATRLAEWRAGISPELDARATDLLQDTDRVPAHLIGMAYSAPGDRNADDLIAALSEMDPLDIKLAVLGYYLRSHPPIEPAAIRRAAAGDAAARADLLEAEKDFPETHAALRVMIERDADGMKQSLVQVLRGFNEEFFAPRRDDVLPILKRDADATTELSKSMPIDRLIETTSGFKFSPDPGLRKVVLIPTYFLRPWMLISEHGDATFFCYSAGDASVPAGSDDPPPTLVRLYKALGDEGRLRLLKMLKTRDVSLKEAADALGVAKSTAHHHLALLRQAGLVWVNAQDGDKVYSLRDDLIPQAAQLLQGYLGQPGRD